MDAASYKVYVILTSGNQLGSNPVTITRLGRGARKTILPEIRFGTLLQPRR